MILFKVSLSSLISGSDGFGTEVVSDVVVDFVSAFVVVIDVASVVTPVVVSSVAGVVSTLALLQDASNAAVRINDINIFFMY